ncbi:uncharacterized protein LOC133907177 [Phragmites australis]|uniref:uncharacterized protein LOC133907177 n=1 Tax=Phragmites australis TaxID=29695 RepID=UPI002D7740CD|nr:uncharacterized protein LOC133907177 [Phragmites australis]
MEDQGVLEAVELVAGAAINEKKDKKARSHLFQMLKSDFNIMRMQKGETLNQYAGKLNTMFVRYTNQGETLDDAILVKKLFDTVSDCFLSVIIGLEQFYDLDTMPFEEVMGWLKTFEECAHPRASSSNSNGDSQPFLTQAEWQVRQKKDDGDSSSSNKGKYHPPSDSNRGRGGLGCDRGHGRGGHGGTLHNYKESGLGGGRRNKSHIKCYNCYKMGHYTNECMAPKKKEEEKGETHLTRTDDTEPTLLLAMSEETALWLQQRRDVLLLNEEK